MMNEGTMKLALDILYSTINFIHVNVYSHKENIFIEKIRNYFKRKSKILFYFFLSLIKNRIILILYLIN